MPGLEQRYIKKGALGNGPSLRTLLSEHGSFLEGKELMMVNFSVTSDDFVRCRSKFYLLTDPAFIFK